MKSPIDTFSDWVKTGKDDGMEKNHFKPVLKIFNLINTSSKKFSIIDAGCGNGWAVRHISKNKNCKSASGVDGSQMMIDKAKSLDNKNDYFVGDLRNWTPQNKVDVVFSMEVFYYFDDPLIVLNNIYQNWLNIDGKLLMGIDFYFENPDCHNWQKKTGVSVMKLMKISEWISIFKLAGFKDVKNYQFCESKSWKGTLVLEGSKV